MKGNLYDVNAYSRDITQENRIGMTDVHNHDYYEIYCFFGDEMDYFLDSTPLILRQNDVVLVDKYLYHKTVYAKSRQQYRINISFNDVFLQRFLGNEYADRVRALMNTPILKECDLAVSKKISETAARLCDCFLKENVVLQEIGFHILSALLLTFVENEKSFFSPVMDDRFSPVQKRMSEIAGYINQNYTENLTLQSVADKFFLNKYYICHSFKAVSGIGITDYINKKRASEAALLLRNSKESVTKIGQLVGFNTQAYFISVFKKYYETTPSCYRLNG